MVSIRGKTVEIPLHLVSTKLVVIELQTPQARIEARRCKLVLLAHSTLFVH